MAVSSSLLAAAVALELVPKSRSEKSARARSATKEQCVANSAVKRGGTAISVRASSVRCISAAASR
eukprot:2072726-Pyramimonas_sp.AAC.1